jgi:hypothetical protein
VSVLCSRLEGIFENLLRLAFRTIICLADGAALSLFSNHVCLLAMETHEPICVKAFVQLDVGLECEGGA